MHTVTKNTLGDSLRTYAWDAEDRLVKITHADNSSTEFSYDGSSRRTRIIEKTAANTITSDRRYLWAGGTQPAEERDATGAITLKQYFGQGEKRIGGADAGSYYYAQDHLGSIREITDSAGTLRARYDYDFWGKRVKLTGTLETEVGYTSHHHHAKSGLVLTNFRAYNPELGTWLSADPIGEAGGMNLYGYALNDPINKWDPLGLDVFFNNEPGNAAHHWVKVGGKSPRGNCGKTYGLYPGRKGKWWGKDPATVESPDRHQDDDRIDWTQYPTTKDQEREIEKWINDNYDVNVDGKPSPRKVKNPAYNTGISDCSKFSRKVRSKLIEIIARDRGSSPFPKIKSGRTK